MDTSGSFPGYKAEGEVKNGGAIPPLPICLQGIVKGKVVNVLN
jgi:hypothetical protein